MRQQWTKCEWQIEKPLKFTRSFGYGRKEIIRISYRKAHHFPASCVLCKFLRFIEKKKHNWLIANPLSRKRRSTKSPHGLQNGGNPHHEAISE
jgi:hypothetical protein